MARMPGRRGCAVLLLCCAFMLGGSPARALETAPGPAADAGPAALLAADAGAGDSTTAVLDPPAAATAAHASPAPSPRRPARDAWGAVRAVGADTWTVFSSPARLDRTGAAWLAGTALVTAVVYNNDEAIRRMLLRQHGDPVYDAVLKVGNNLEPLGYMGRTAPYYAGAMVLGYALRNRPLTEIPAQFLESHFIAGGVRNLTKPVVGRRRPFEQRGSRSFEFDGGTSFPSGHTSVAFELATVLSMHAKRWPVTVGCYGLASTIALQRVDSGNHWASDVIVPAITGTFVARTVVAHGADRSWAVVPALAPGREAGVQLVVSF